MKKLFTLVMLMVCAIGTAWAESETISLVTYTVADNIATLTGDNVTVVLSRTNGQAVNDPDSKSRGLRWQNGRTITVEVKEGYKINSVKLTSGSNGNNTTSIEFSLTDGTNALSGSWDKNLNGDKAADYTWTATSGTGYSTWVLTNTGSKGDIYFSGVTVGYEEYTAVATAPTIITQPASSLEAFVGYEAQLTVGATGEPTPSYQWYSNTTASNKGGSEIEGATTATYKFTPESTGTYYYYAVATNTEGSATSEVATVTVGLKYKVSYNAGESGASISIPLATSDYAAGTKITLPTNHYFYKEGQTVTKWSDGSNEYALGSEYTVNGDVTFVPVFADNSKSLGSEETTITWTFATENGAPTYAVEGDGKTTTVIGTTANGIDLKADVNLAKIGDSTGKFNNASGTNRAQVNASVSFTIPAIMGMTVKYTATNGTPSVEDEVLFGEVKATSVDNKDYVYTYEGSDATLTITDNKGGLYPSGISVTYPNATKCSTPTITAGGFSFEKKGYEVTITAGKSTETLNVSTDGTNFSEQTSPYTTYITSETTFYAKDSFSGLSDSDVAELKVTPSESFDSSKPFVAWVYTKGYGSAEYAFETDPMVTALKNSYNVVEVNYAADVTPSADLNNADLIVCTEAMAGGKTMSNGLKAFVGVTPMIGLKAYNYTKGRWSWGAPANPNPTAQDFTPKSALYKVLDGVTYEEDGSIVLATATSGNVVQTVSFGTTDTTTPEGNVILGTIGDDDTKAVMYVSPKYFGLGLSSDCWSSYSANAITIVKNAAAMLIAGDDLTATNPVEVTIGSTGYATFSSKSAVDFSDADVTVYTAKVEGSKAVLSEVESKKVPANTGVILKGSGTVSGAVIAEADALTNNHLIAATSDVTTTGIYILVPDGESVKFTTMTSGTLKAGKAYLPAASSARELNLVFGEATGISEMKNVNTSAEVYNLNGMRIAQPTKGLYIQNGKKLIVK